MLVFVNVMYNATSGYDEPIIEGYWKYETMYECFQARESLSVNLGMEPGYYPIGTQGVCIKMKESL